MGPDRDSAGIGSRLFGAVALGASLVLIVLIAIAAVSAPDSRPLLVTNAAPTTTSTDSPVGPRDVRDPRAARSDVRAGAAESERSDDGHPIVRVRNGRRIDLREKPEGERVSTAGDETEFGSPSVFSVVRRDERWLGVTSPEVPNGELGWIKADPDKLDGGYVEYGIDVDLSDRRAKLHRNGEVVMGWPITIGGPNSETPTGRFAVTDTFRGGLNPAYGCCALALSATQPDLPADWPGGDRIAIHGTGGPLGRSVSYGCIRSADAVVDRLVDQVPLGTPVVIRP